MIIKKNVSNVTAHGVGCFNRAVEPLRFFTLLTCGDRGIRGMSLAFADWPKAKAHPSPVLCPSFWHDG